MKNKVLRLVAVIFGAVLWVAPAVSLERDEVADRYKWDLSTLFGDGAAWVAAKDSLRQDIPKLASWHGRLGESPATLQPFDAAMRESNRIMDVIERADARQKR